MTSLILFHSRYQIPLLPLLRDHSDDILVIGLDFRGRQVLRDRGFPFRVPNEYLEVASPAEMDAKARRFAESWYRDIEASMTHRGVSLGEMAEYDFLFLFIDAIRSVEIAHSILHQHRVDRVVLPGPLPPRPPNAVCHETLPRALAFLSQEMGIPIRQVMHERSRRLIEGDRGRDNEAGRPYRRVHEFLASTIADVLVWIGSLVTLHRARQADVHFIHVPFHREVARGLHNLGLRAAPLEPPVGGWFRALVTAHAATAAYGQVAASQADRFSHRGVPLLTLLTPRLDAFFWDGLPRLYRLVEGFERVLRLGRGRCLVVTDDIVPVHRTVCRAFLDERRPVLVVQHGAVSADAAGFHVMPKEAPVQAVWGEACREWHLARGKEPETQIVTGNPGFDPILDVKGMDVDKLRERLGLPLGTPVFVFATEWFSGPSVSITEEQQEAFLRRTLSALTAFPDATIVVKLHPTHAEVYRGRVKALAAEVGLEISVFKDRLWELLAAADLVLVSNSTVGLEAMILDRPVIAVECYPSLEKVPYAASGAALGAATRQEIRASIRRIMEDEQTRKELARARRRFVRDYGHEQDGRASLRVASLIESLLASAE